MARSTESFKTFTDRTVRINFIPLNLPNVVRFLDDVGILRPKSQHKMFVKHHVCSHQHMFLRAKAVFPKIRGQHAYIMG